MKKLNEKELVEVKGGFIGGVADPNGSFFVLRNFKVNKKQNRFNWKRIFGLKKNAISGFIFSYNRFVYFL